jgi:hypothetical protein
VVARTHRILVIYATAAGAGAVATVAAVELIRTLT